MKLLFIPVLRNRGLIWKLDNFEVQEIPLGGEKEAKAEKMSETSFSPFPPHLCLALKGAGRLEGV